MRPFPLVHVIFVSLNCAMKISRRYSEVELQFELLIIVGSEGRKNNVFQSQNKGRSAKKLVAAR